MELRLGCAETNSCVEFIVFKCLVCEMEMQPWDWDRPQPNGQLSTVPAFTELSLHPWTESNAAVFYTETSVLRG